MQWAGAHICFEGCVVLGLYWDNPEVTPAEKCRFDACITVPAGTAVEGNVNLQTISGGPYAVCHFETKAESFKQAWEDTFAWLVQSGCECDERPCYELYHNNPAEHPEGKCIFDICVPLKQKH